MRDAQDDLDRALTCLRMRQDRYPDTCEAYQVLDALRKDIEAIKESGR